MNSKNIIQQRLSNQHVAGNPLETAADVVARFGAVQAQDYAGAKWAVGQRVQGATDTTLDPSHAHMIETSNPIFGHFLVIEGRMVGTWRRDFEKEKVTITMRCFLPLNAAQEEAIHTAAENYGKFMGLVIKIQAQKFIS